MVRADRETVANGVQRHRPAEPVAVSQSGHVDILAARIGVAERRLQHGAGKRRIGEAEEIDGAGVRRSIAGPMIERRAHGEAIPGGVQRNAKTELVIRLQRRDVHILAARIARADHALEGAAGKVRIGEAEEINRAGVLRAIIDPVVQRCADGEAVPGGVQRDRRAEKIARAQPRRVRLGRITKPHHARIRPIADDGRLISDNDVLGVDEEMPARADRNAVKRSASQVLGGGDLDRAAAGFAAGVDGAEEGGLRVRPDHRRAAGAPVGADVDDAGVVDEGRAGVVEAAGVFPAGDEAVVVGLRGVGRFAALEGAADAHASAADAPARVEGCGEEAHVACGHVDASAFAV